MQVSKWRLKCLVNKMNYSKTEHYCVRSNIVQNIHYLPPPREAHAHWTHLCWTGTCSFIHIEFGPMHLEWHHDAQCVLLCFVITAPSPDLANEMEAVMISSREAWNVLVELGSSSCTSAITMTGASPWQLLALQPGLRMNIPGGDLSQTCSEQLSPPAPTLEAEPLSWA